MNFDYLRADVRRAMVDTSQVANVFHFGSSVNMPRTARDVDLCFVTKTGSAESVRAALVSAFGQTARVEPLFSYTGGGGPGSPSLRPFLHLLVADEVELARPSPISDAVRGGVNVTAAFFS